MTSRTPQIFTGVTSGQYAKLKERARAEGIELNGNCGRASKMGIEVEWNYTEEKQELVLTCMETPFLSAPTR
jgi:hypothetical protein